jgi:hypothetical protein
MPQKGKMIYLIWAFYHRFGYKLKTVVCIQQKQLITDMFFFFFFFPNSQA